MWVCSGCCIDHENAAVNEADSPVSLLSVVRIYQQLASLNRITRAAAATSSVVLEVGELDLMRTAKVSSTTSGLVVNPPKFGHDAARWRRRFAAMGLGLVMVSAEIRDKRRWGHCNIRQSLRCR